VYSKEVLLNLDLHLIRERIENSLDEELLQMIRDGSEEWQPEVLALVQTELEKRGTNVERVASELETAPTGEWPLRKDTPPEKRRGVGGWLGFLVSKLVFTSWIGMLFGMNVILVSPLFGAWQAATYAYLFFSGIKLWKEKPGAVLHTQRALVSLAALNAAFILFVGNLVALTWQDFSYVILPLVWIAYLRTSRRVLNTFPSWASHLEKAAEPMPPW